MSRILLVDDDENLLEVTQRYLKRAEPTLTLIISSSAQEALQVLKKDHLDVVVSDYQMPTMDGLELLQKLREEGNDVPFVMFTGKGREDVAMQALNLGANYYLMKGDDARSTFGELAHIIRQLTHHQHVEKALQETEELANHIIESMTDGILALDRNYHYTLWSQAMEKISHVPREELIGTSRRPWEVFPHLAEQGVDQMMKRAMEGEVVHREDIPYRLVDGTTGFTTETFFPLRSDIGEIRGIVGIIRDISEHKRSQIALKESEERTAELAESEEKYRFLFEATPIGVGIAALTGEIIAANESMQQLTGYSMEEFRVANIKDTYVDPIERERLLRALRETGEVRDQEVRLRRKNGQVYVALLNVDPIELGGELALLTTAQDITKQKQAENALRKIRNKLEIKIDERTAELAESEALYRFLFDNVPIGLGLAERDGSILTNNKTMLQMLGYSMNELQKIDSTILYVNPKDHVNVFEIMQESGHVHDYELQMRRKDGTVYDALISINLAQIRDKTLILTTALDITDRKRAELAFQDSQRELTIRNRIGDAFLMISDEEVYREVLEIILSAMQSKHGIFGYIDDTGSLVQASLTEDIWDQCAVPEKTILFPPTTWHGIFGRCLKNREAYFSNEPFKVPTGHIPIEQALGVPIVHHGNIIGLLMVANKSANYIETDQETLKALANYVAPMLHARLQKHEQKKKRERAEEALHINYRLLEIANRYTEMKPLLNEFVAEIQNYTGCIATGIRFLDIEGNIPYEAHKGFSQSFYESESPLSIRSDHCMCINVIKGNFDPKLSFFTEYGSFYMNGTTKFLATVSEEEKGQTRNVCNMVGFESVGLVPIRLGDRILGLIHVADYQENKVPLEIVEILEKIALQVAAALQRVLSEEELKRQKEELSEFAHAMAHDLRSPLLAIEGLATLQQEKSNPADMERIGHLAKKTQALLQRSVNLADAGQVIEKTDRSDLTELVKTAAQVSIPENVAFKTEQLPTILCDQVKVEQLFKNLFENAAVHGNPQMIEVRKQIIEDRTNILISNDGTPIPPEYRSKIFQLGFTSRENGSGLGLTIVQKVVSAHGWQISLADTPETTFVIQIPAVS